MSRESMARILPDVQRQMQNFLTNTDARSGTELRKQIAIGANALLQEFPLNGLERVLIRETFFPQALSQYKWQTELRRTGVINHLDLLSENPEALPLLKERLKVNTENDALVEEIARMIMSLGLEEQATNNWFTQMRTATDELVQAFCANPNTTPDASVVEESLFGVIKARPPMNDTIFASLNLIGQAFDAKHTTQ